MKLPIPQEERGRTLSYITVVCVGILFAMVLLHLKQLGETATKVLGAAMPFIIGFAVALLLLPVVKRVEQFFTKLVFRRKPHPKLSRTLSVIIAFIALLALVAGFFAILVPQLIASITSILQYISHFDINRFVMRTTRSISGWLSGIHLLGIEGAELAAAWEETVAGFTANLSSNGSEEFVNYSSGLLSWILNYSSDLLNGVMTLSSGVYTVVLQLFIGLISAFYLLMDRETFCAQIKKILYATMGGKPVARAMLRLTKGSFTAPGEKAVKSLEFADILHPDVNEQPEKKNEELVVFLERLYTNGIDDLAKQTVQKLFAELATEKAKEMGARVVLSHDYRPVAADMAFTAMNYYLYISKSKAGEQYLDSLGGSQGASKEGSYYDNIFMLQAA